MKRRASRLIAARMMTFDFPQVRSEGLASVEASQRAHERSFAGTDGPSRTVHPGVWDVERN